MLIEKSRSLSFILTTIFGPLGLLYANWKIAIIPILIGLSYNWMLEMGLMWVIAVIHIGCIVAGDFLIKAHNRKVFNNISKQEMPLSYNES